MKLRVQPTASLSGAARARRGTAALTLVEMAFAVGVGSLVLLVVTLLSVYAMRSFASIGNYTALDARNRLAVDKINRDLHEATLLIPPYADASVKWLKFTNSVRGGTFKYIWYPDDRLLICERDGRDETYLTECDEWSYAFFQRTPVPNSLNTFAPATNWAGQLDVSSCKVIELHWKCSRAMMGKKWTTESVQAVRVMLRNSN